MPKILYLTLTILFGGLLALSAQAPNLVALGDLEFMLNIHADKRIQDYFYEDLAFQASSQSWPDSLVITYTAPELDLIVNVSYTDEFWFPSHLFNIRANFKEEIYLHELYLSMDKPGEPINARLKGVEAILSGDPSRNRNITPYVDKAVQYDCGDDAFWIVASGYAGCEGIEGLAGNNIHLYDYRVHYYRVFHHSAQATNMLRDTMFKTAGSTHEWSFLLFREMPVLLDINRWLGNRRAALCISNDADGETMNRLQAVYEGSNNPENPKYHTQGFFARNIPVTNTIHGVNQPTLEPMWDLIMDHGNAIGWHTYTQLADPPGTNEQALLHDLVKYNIRTWVDHCVPNNPEDIIYNGLYPDSTGYVADVVNQSEIDYIWPADTPLNNPFNAYDEPWRLPHIVYEAKTLNRPIWFFGRTRTETWEYTNGYNSVCMKHVMTPANLDQLLAERGLHHSYTHFCVSQSWTARSFWEIEDSGDYVIRDDADEMLQMLDYYRDYRGLWIATMEDIYDRMLAIEQVRIRSVEKNPQTGVYSLALTNSSEMDIPELCIYHRNLDFEIPLFASGTQHNLSLAAETSGTAAPPPPYRILYQAGSLILKRTHTSTTVPITIDIYNLRGQKVQTNRYQYYPPEIVLPFAGKPSGIYFARIRDPELSVPVVLRFTVLK